MFTKEVNEKLYEYNHNNSCKCKWAWHNRDLWEKEARFVTATLKIQLDNIANARNGPNSSNIRWNMTKDTYKFLTTNVAKQYLECYPEFKVTVYEKLLDLYYRQYKYITNAKESTVKRQISGYCIDIFGIPIGHRNGDMSAAELRKRELPMNKL
jgi:hypothetical protein